MGPLKSPCYKGYVAISELVIMGFPCTCNVLRTVWQFSSGLMTERIKQTVKFLSGAHSPVCSCCGLYRQTHWLLM